MRHSLQTLDELSTHLTPYFTFFFGLVTGLDLDTGFRINPKDG